MKKFVGCRKNALGKVIAVFYDTEDGEQAYNKSSLKLLMEAVYDREPDGEQYQEIVDAWCEMARFSHEDEETASRMKLEYLVDVEWFYDNMPQNKHRKTESIMATDRCDAIDTVARMYPNSTVHSAQQKD